MARAMLDVPDISCGHCEQTIITALKDMPGVQRVAVSIADKQVRLDYDPAALNLDTVKAALAEEDYPVASVTPA